MKNILAIVLLASVTALSCATPDTPRTEPGMDTPRVTPPDTAKMIPDSTRM